MNQTNESTVGTLASPLSFLDLTFQFRTLEFRSAPSRSRSRSSKKCPSIHFDFEQQQQQ